MADQKWSNRDFGALPSVLVAAHELKSPLALVRQLSLLLEDDQLQADKRLELQRQVSQVSTGALKLVEDLALTANLSPSLFPLEPVNPLAVCRQVADEISPMAKLYGHQVTWPRRKRSNELVVANGVLLNRILTNFIANALKYSQAGLPIDIIVKQTKGLVRIGVRDRGPMMARREYRKLIDEMATMKTVRTRPDSSGLGIYVASQFAQAMDGQIGLIRHRDGLTFYVDMPISRQMSWL
ncbi:hypothetical protein CR969_03155 [Candidatus Saccharibacteria bacterium]|nr:MAG: hypothetical protein CR969_03155 [Candidatus Saccharibacteria bacterium]